MKRRGAAARWLGRTAEPLEPRLLLAGPGDDVGDTRELANTLAFTYGVSGQFGDEIGRPEDVDIFRLDLRAGDLVSLKIVPVGGGEFQFFGALRTFGEVSDVTRPDDQQLQFRATETGTIHVGVSGFGNDQYNPDQYDNTLFGFTGDYRLEFVVERGSAEIPDDTIAGARSVELTVGAPQQITGRIEAPLDVDIVAVNLLAGQLLSVQVETVAGPANSAAARIFDATGAEVELDPCLNAPAGKHTVRAETDGTYYVGVAGAGNTAYDPHTIESGVAGSIGEYTLVLGLEAGAPLGDGDRIAEAIPLCFATTGVPRERIRNGEIATAADVDLYRIELGAQEQLRVDVEVDPASSVLLSVVRLFSANGAPVVDNVAAANGGLANPPLFFAAPAGTYYLGVSAVGNANYNPQFVNSAQGQSFGRYSLAVQVIGAPLDDGNETLSEAQPFQFSPGLPSTLEGELDAGNDVDFYALDLEAGDQLRLTLDPLGTLAGSVSLFGAAGAQLPLANEGGNSSFTATALGTYFVAVASADNTTFDPSVARSGAGSQMGAYALSAHVEPAPFSDGNDTLDDADGFEVAPGVEASVTGRVDVPSDVDLYRVQLAAGDRLRLSLVEPGGISAFDGVLRAFDAGGDELALGVDDNGYTLHSAGGGALYLGVSAPGNSGYGPLSAENRPAGVLGGDGQYVLRAILDRAPQPATETEPNDDLSQPQVLLPNQEAAASLSSPADVDRYAVDVTTPSRLEARLVDDVGQPAAMQLVLSDASGVTVATSAPGSASLTQHVPPGRYLLTVTAGSALVTPAPYRIVTRLVAATSPLEDLLLAEGVSALASGDFNGDGIVDAFVANELEGTITLLVGLGDGTFSTRPSITIGDNPVALAAADFTGDGRLDLAVARRTSSQLTLLSGLGDGSFAAARELTIGTGATALAAGDFSGDGVADLAVAVASSQGVVIVTGLQGVTPAQRVVSITGAANALWAGDLNGDGRADLAITLGELNRAVILPQASDGTFGIEIFDVDGRPSDIVAADFDGDRDVDIAIGRATDGNVTLLRRQAGGSFAASNVIVDVDRLTSSSGTTIRTTLAAADFDGGGRADLAVGNTFAHEGAVLLSDGQGGFRPALKTELSGAIVALAAADLNGDGRADLLAANNDPARHGLAVRLGRGNGTFQQEVRLPVGADPHAIVSVDLNSDGLPDLVSSSFAGVTIQLGIGDGAFGAPRRITADQPQALVAGDFNRDGRPDLAAAMPFRGALSEVDNRVAVWLGLGDGTFRDATFYTVGQLPLDLAAGDFNGDNIDDLAVANGASNDVSVLFNAGDGTFALAATLLAGRQPSSIEAADIDGDGQLDLATANELDDTVIWWRNQRNGVFQTVSTLSVGNAPSDLVAGDVDADGRIDLVTADHDGDTVSFQIQQADGSFTRQEFAISSGPRALALVRGNGDAPRLAVTLDGDDQVAVLRRDPSGVWVRDADYATGRTPLALVATDLNGDSFQDLAALNAFTNDVTLLFGDAKNVFRNAAQVTRELAQGKPVFADVNGDGVLDSLALRQSGEVLLRLGRAGDEGTFDAPIVLNRGRTAIAVQAVASADGIQIATLDRDGNSVAMYRLGANGAPALANVLATGGGAVRIAAGDLNGDGRDDLVVANAADATLTVFMASGDGAWQTSTIESGSSAPTDIAILDVDGGGADLIVTDGRRGEVRLIRNLGAGDFALPLIYRTGAGPYQFIVNSSVPSGALFALAESSTFLQLSREGTAGFTFGDFDGDGLLDLVALNPGSNTFAVLAGRGADGLSNPLAFATGDRPSDVAIGDFNRDGRADLAILLAGDGRIQFYLGDGQGNFAPGQNLEAGNLPSGLAAIDVDRDGLVDLVIGNEFGDLMTFQGRGDGTFAPFTRADADVPLAVADLDGDGVPEVIVANRALDRLSVQRPEGQQPAEGALTAEEIFQQQREAGLVAPGAVEMADINGDGRVDMLVANSGGNELLVYLGLGDGTFAEARRFFAGTNPSGLTISDVNGDGRLDVVIANAGSNDISVLLGDTAELLRPGPRLSVGATPVATVAEDVNQDGAADLLVANSGDNSVTLLLGVGGGFFDDTQPIRFPTGADPRSLFVGQFDGRPGNDLVTINARGGSLTFFPNFLSGFLTPVTIATGGLRPTSAAVRDFNADGRLDLAVSNNASGSLSLILGTDGGLSLAAVLEDLGLEHPSSLEIIDFGGESGLRLVVTDEGDEQPFLFTPRDFLPKNDPGNGPVLAGSGLLLTLFQGGLRVLAASALALPDALPGNVAELLGTLLGDAFATGDGDEALAQRKGNSELPLIGDIMQLGDVVASAVQVTFDGLLTAFNAVLANDLSQSDLAAWGTAVGEWLVPEVNAGGTQGASPSLSALLAKFAGDVARSLDVEAVDAAIERLTSDDESPAVDLGEFSIPGTLVELPARAIPAPPAESTASDVRPAAIEEEVVEGDAPAILPPGGDEPAPLRASWTWRLWAVLVSTGVAALGTGGYVAQRNWRRRQMEALHLEQH